MLTRRIIPCLDIRAGRVVKGINFEDLVDVGDPVERSSLYMRTGADELCFLDVAASVENRGLSNELVERIAKTLAIPFTVGGGIRSVDEARGILRAGADKVALNTAALTDPDLLSRLANDFGRQCVVISAALATLATLAYPRHRLHDRSRFSTSACIRTPPAAGVKRGRKDRAAQLVGGFAETPRRECLLGLEADSPSE